MMFASLIRRAVSLRTAMTAAPPVFSHVTTANPNPNPNPNVQVAPVVVSAPEAQPPVGDPRTAVLRDEQDLLTASIQRHEAERELAGMRRQCEEELRRLRDGVKVREEQVVRIVRRKMTKGIMKKHAAPAHAHTHAHGAPNAFHNTAMHSADRAEVLRTAEVSLPQGTDPLTTRAAAKLSAKASEAVLRAAEQKEQVPGRGRDQQQGQSGEQRDRYLFPHTVDPPPPNHTDPAPVEPSPAEPPVVDPIPTETSADTREQRELIDPADEAAEDKAPATITTRPPARRSSTSSRAKGSGKKATSPSSSASRKATDTKKIAKKPVSEKGERAKKPAAKKAAPKKAVAPPKNAPARAKPAAKKVPTTKKATQGKKKPVAKPKAKKPVAKPKAKKPVAKPKAKKPVAKPKAKKPVAKPKAKKPVAKPKAKKPVAKPKAKKPVAKPKAKKPVAKPKAKKPVAKPKAKKPVAKPKAKKPNAKSKK